MSRTTKRKPEGGQADPAATQPTVPIVVTHALSIIQPLAGLVIKGVKPLENRSWTTDHRSMIAIHASSKFFPGVLRELWDRGGIDFRVPAPADASENWPTRAIVGVVELVDCIHYGGQESKRAIVGVAKAAGILPPRPTGRQVDDFLFWGDVDCHVWILANPIEFKQPISANGKLHLWQLSPEQQAAVNRAVAGSEKGSHSHG